MFIDNLKDELNYSITDFTFANFIINNTVL